MFIIKFVKIILSSILMGIFFLQLISLFETQLSYEYNFKFFYMILAVILCIIFYFIISFFIKAFDYKDLKLKY